MAQRRSRNRRWSRKSLNATELDQDSEIIDGDNAMWWKNIEGDVTMRPSLPVSLVETTGSVLDNDSRIDPSKLGDKWWDNLDRTKLGSSRRFSTRKSINTGDTVEESLNSEGDDDVSIKKRKILLRPRANKSGGNDNFLKVFDESIVQSELLPGKRKSKSPARSDTEVSRKKTRTRRSNAAETSRDNPDDASFTSNDTDIIVKQRPKLFKKRSTTKVRDSAFDNVLQNEEPGPYGINNSKNASRHSDSPLSKTSGNVTPRAIDSNESGLMGPPTTGSLRKRLSTITRKLNLASDESESDGAPKKARSGFAKKAREDLSINPFDEILSGHLEEENSQSGVRMNKNVAATKTSNKSAAAAKTPNKSRQGRGDDPVIGVTSIVDEEDQTSTMETVQMSDSASRTQVPDMQQTPRNSTVDLAKTRGEETENLLENNRRSISVTKEIPRVSTRPLDSKGRSTLLSRQSAVAQDSRSQVIQDWESMDSEEEELVNKPSKSMSNVSKGASSIKKTLAVSKTRLSSMRISRSQRIDESEQNSDEQEEMVEDKNRSLKSASHSRIIADSAYELPDQERSDSPIVSLSENENDKSADKSTQNKRKTKSVRKSANRSIPHDKANVSKTGSARMNASPQKIDSDESISEEEARILEKSKRRSTKRDSRVDDRASTSEKSAARANISRRQTLLDDIISEEEVDEETKNNSKSSSLSVKNKSNTARKSASYWNTSRQIFLSEESSNEEEAEDAEKSKSMSTKRNLPTEENSSRQRIESDESITEEEEEDAEKSNSESTKRSLLAKGRNSNAAKNRSVPINVSEEGIDSDDTQDAEKSNSKSANSPAMRKASVARNSSANVTARQESAANVSEEDEHEEHKINSKSANLSAKRKISTARKSIAHGNVSKQRVESDEGSNDENPEKSNSKSANLSAKGKISTSRKSVARGKVSGQRVESDEKNAQDEDKSYSKSANLSAKKKTSTARKSIARGNVSGQRIESDERPNEEDPTKKNSKSLNLSTKGKVSISRKDAARGNVSGQRIEPDVSEEEVDDPKNINSVAAKGASESTRLPKNISIVKNTTNRDTSTLSTAEHFVEQNSTVSSDAIPLAAKLTKLPNNQSKNQSNSVLGNGNVSRTQKNITDFFQSKFLQKSDPSTTTLDLTTFDHEKLNFIRQEMDKIKQQEIEAMKIDVSAKKKESRHPDNAMRAKNLRSKDNVSKAAAKPAKVVDKAFIVNGTVYKRPKLPRPKPWVTDRLYRHLWKKMEPKFNLSTRIKSEKFVEQLSEVVAVTIRRKKYDSYKLELDALMKEMAKLGIIKTRNDFYDFCYDFMPYDFRVKATPILMPGNVRNIPYDPETLHTPILAESSSRSG